MWAILPRLIQIIQVFEYNLNYPPSVELKLWSKHEGLQYLVCCIWELCKTNYEVCYFRINSLDTSYSSVLSLFEPCDWSIPFSLNQIYEIYILRLPFSHGPECQNVQYNLCPLFICFGKFLHQICRNYSSNSLWQAPLPHKLPPRCKSIEFNCFIN